MAASPVIEAKGLVKKYGDRIAVSGIDRAEETMSGGLDRRLAVPL